MTAAESHPSSDPCWLELHEWFVSTAKAKEADVLFIGGDHIALLQQSQVFKDRIVQYYLEKLAPLHCVCFGSFSDTAANLLWRIQNGEADNFTPKVIVVSIGQSDDASVTTPADLLRMLKRIGETLKEKQPQAEIFFLQLLPSGRRGNPRRQFVGRVNAQMESELNGVASVIPTDPSLVGIDFSVYAKSRCSLPNAFDQSGEIDVHHMFDFVHLSQTGYETVFKPVLAAINSVFNL